MKRSLASAAAADRRLEGGALLAGGEALGGLAAGFDDAGQLALFLSIEEGDLADVVQVETDGVVHGNASQLVRVVVRFRGRMCHPAHDALLDDLACTPVIPMGGRYWGDRSQYYIGQALSCQNQSCRVS